MSVAPREIICDRCNRPVDRITEWRDDFCGRIRVKVECHGETQTEEISFRELRDVRDKDISFGRAFIQAPALPAESPQ